MPLSREILAVSSSVLTILSSIVELVLSSLVYQRLQRLNGLVDYSFRDGPAGTAEDPFSYVSPLFADLTWEQLWLPFNDEYVWPVIRSEIAIGSLALVMGLSVCFYVGWKNWSSRRSNFGSQSSTFTKLDWSFAALSTVFTIAILGLFAYIFTTSDDSASNSNVGIGNPLDSVGFDLPPTWEDYTCAMSSYLEQNQGFVANRSQWKLLCRLTTGARWTTLPVFLLTMLAIISLYRLQYPWFLSSKASPPTKAKEFALDTLSTQPHQDGVQM